MAEHPLQLYRRILRLHRQKLPHDLRSMGDSYVKKEFRDHRNAKPDFVKTFMVEWSKYADSMEGGDYRRDLDQGTVTNMSEDQQASLQRLREEATNFKPI